MSFEIPFEDRYWETVRERMENSHPLDDDEHQETELGFLVGAMMAKNVTFRMVKKEEKNA